jgi:hypothetical protein
VGGNLPSRRAASRPDSATSARRLTALTSRQR